MECQDFADGDQDPGDFTIECVICGTEFTAGENFNDAGDHIQCPECGAIDPE